MRDDDVDVGRSEDRCEQYYEATLALEERYDKWEGRFRF